MIDSFEVEKLTHLIFCFCHLKGNRLSVNNARDSATIQKMVALKSRNPQLKIILSLGGWGGCQTCSPVFTTKEGRKEFAKSVRDLNNYFGTDGIDLDWEYPGLPGPGIVHRDDDKRNFTLLLHTLRERLDALGAKRNRRMGDHYLITAALADSEFVGHIELDRIHQYLDWIDLMTYDFHNSLTPATGHHSALAVSATSQEHERSVERAVAQFLAAGVPAPKLIVGVPFYGRAFADVRAENHGLDQPYGHYDSDYPWPRLKADFIGRNGFERHWDDKAKVPYLWNSRTRTFVSYDDPESLALKAGYVKAHKLGGMMYWEQSQDPAGELLEVLSRSLR